MHFLHSLAICALMLAATHLRAQEIPEDIRILVPLTAGSSLDARARIIADAIGKRLKRRVIVENRAGAGGTLGTSMVARSRPDGSILLFNNNSHVISPHIYADIGYDPIKDFVPVAQAYVSGLVLVAHPDFGVNSLKELVAKARNSPQPPSYASSGTGGVPHLAMELFLSSAGIKLLHIPYKGDGQALTDVLAGRVPLLMSGYQVVLPHIQSGRLRALAITSRTRVAILPDVPTIAQSGYPDYVLDAWAGFFAPVGTPAAVVAKLNREIAAALATPALRELLAATGAQTVGTPPGAFADYVVQEWRTYGKLVRELQLKAQ